MAVACMRHRHPRILRPCGPNLPDVEFMWDIEQDVSWTYDLGALVDSLDLYRSDLLAPQ